MEFDFEDGDIYAMLSAFLDESKTAEKHPVIAVGGGLGTGLQWKNLLRAWQQALDTEPDVKVFHTVDFETPEGRKNTVYENWSSERRLRFNQLLTDAISQNQIEAVEVALVKPEDFEEVAKVRSKVRPIHPSYNAYTYCAHSLIEQIMFRANNLYPNQLVSYYFEQGGDHQSSILRAYEEIKNNEKLTKRHKFWKTPIFAPKDRFVALQVADKLVYEMAKHASHYFDDDPPEKHSILADDGKIRWKMRFSTDQWYRAGLVMSARAYQKNDIEEEIIRMEAVAQEKDNEKASRNEKRRKRF